MTSTTARWLWGFLALIGAILPLSQLVPWLSNEPSNIVWFWDQATKTPAARTVMADILWAAVIFSGYVVAKTIHARRYILLWSVLLTWTIGLSCGLPLYFALRGTKET